MTYSTPKVMRILKYLRVSPVVSGVQSQFSFRHIRASKPRTFAIVKFYNREFTSIAAKYCFIDVSTCLLLRPLTFRLCLISRHFLHHFIGFIIRNTL